MKNLVLLLCSLLVISGCTRDEDIYPRRPVDTPYFYNDTSVTEINQDLCIALRRARENTGDEFVAVLLKKVPDNITVEKYAAGLFHKWKIGSRTKGKGVLVLFVEDTHTLKIETSQNLEPLFTDAFCSIFQPTLKSYYAGRYFADVFCNAIECLARRVVCGSEYEARDFRRPVDEEYVFISAGSGIVDDEYFYEKDAKLPFIKNIPYEKIREFDADPDIKVVIERYLQSLKEGINYPFLGLLTEGGQMMRLEYPESPHFYQSRWQDCQDAMPYEIKYKEDLAALRFAKGQSLPIFLRKTADGLWKVDVARAWACSWQNFADNKSGPLYDDHPWIFAFPEYKSSSKHFSVPPLLPPSVNLYDEIVRLENEIKANPDVASNYFKLADIFYWDCFWVAPSIDLVEKGLALEPRNVPYRWLVIDMRYRFRDSQPNLEHIQMLFKSKLDDVDTLLYYSRHFWFYMNEYKKAIGLLQKAEKVEKRLNINAPKSQQCLQSYKDNFWNQLFIDTNFIYRLRMYFYIFYWTENVALVGVIIVVALFVTCYQLLFRSIFNR